LKRANFELERPYTAFRVSVILPHLFSDADIEKKAMYLYFNWA